MTSRDVAPDGWNSLRIPYGARLSELLGSRSALSWPVIAAFFAVGFALSMASLRLLMDEPWPTAALKALSAVVVPCGLLLVVRAMASRRGWMRPRVGLVIVSLTIAALLRSPNGVFVPQRRDIASARRFFTTALAAHRAPAEVITDRAPALAKVVDELIPAAFHNTGQYENNRCECDHGRLKSRLRPMRGLKTDRTACIVIRGYAFIQNVRRGHYELGVEAAPVLQLPTAFDELRLAI